MAHVTRIGTTGSADGATPRNSWGR